MTQQIKIRSRSVKGFPKILLHIEGLLVMAAALSAYSLLEFSWTLFAFVFLLPDLGLLGYLIGPRTGAVTYNTTHTSSLPLLLSLVAWFIGWIDGQAIALIWLSHIGFDRMLGFGLKYGDGIIHTHMGILGRPQTQE